MGYLEVREGYSISFQHQLISTLRLSQPDNVTNSRFSLHRSFQLIAGLLIRLHRNT